MGRKRVSARSGGSVVSLEHNEGVCIKHCLRILAAYDRIIQGTADRDDHAVFAYYGIKQTTRRQIAQDADPLLAICLEWRTSDTNDTFFNNIGQGDRLEELLVERLGDQVTLKQLK
jgi:hypothetical protein